MIGRSTWVLTLKSIFLKKVAKDGSQTNYPASNSRVRYCVAFWEEPLYSINNLKFSFLHVSIKNNLILEITSLALYQQSECSHLKPDLVLVMKNIKNVLDSEIVCILSTLRSCIKELMEAFLNNSKKKQASKWQ